MSDRDNEKPYSSAMITIGKVIGGAALAAGAVVLGTVIFQGLNIGDAQTAAARTEESRTYAEGAVNKLSSFGQTLAKIFLTKESLTPVSGDYTQYADVAGRVQAVDIKHFAGSALVEDKMALSNLGMGIIGAGVAGTGYALYSAMDGRDETNRSVIESQASCDAPVRGGHAEAEQVRALAALQNARLMATNPEYFAAVAQGRGA